MYANLSLLSQKFFFIYTAKGYHDSEGCTHYESVFVELRYFGKHLATELPVIVSKLAIWLVVKKEKFQASYCFGTLCFHLDVCNICCIRCLGLLVSPAVREAATIQMLPLKAVHLRSIISECIFMTKQPTVSKDIHRLASHWRHCGIGSRRW